MPYHGNQEYVWLMFIVITILPLTSKAMDNRDSYISCKNDKDTPMVISVSTGSKVRKKLQPRKYLYLSDNILADNGREKTIFMPPKSYVTLLKPTSTFFIDQWENTVSSVRKRQKISSHFYEKNIPTTGWDNTGYKDLGLLVTKDTIRNQQLVNLAALRIISYVERNIDKQAISYLLSLKREAKK